MLFMDGLCYKGAVGSHHETSQLGADCHVIHARGYQDFLINLAHAVPNGQYIVGFLVRAVGNADAAGQIDELHMGPCLLLEPYRQFKEDFCKHGIVLQGHRVAGQEGMDAKMLRTLVLQYLKCLKHLLCGHPVFGIPGIVHDVIAHLEHAARIKTAADGLRDISQGLLQALNMGYVVQVDDGSQLLSICKFLRRSVIG